MATKAWYLNTDSVPSGREGSSHKLDPDSAPASPSVIIQLAKSEADD